VPVTRINVISLPVADQDRAAAFYTEVLGFSVVHDNRVSPDMRWLQIATPGTGTDVVLATWLEGVPPGAARGGFLEVGDIRAERDGLIAAGVEVAEPMDTPWGWFAEFGDPDGNRWTLHQPPGA
jgi:predicted enzyme related to lactoylglutathione lyase